MGFNVYNDSLEYINQKKKSIVINTISPNSYGISSKDKYFKQALINSDYLVLDGVYFALASIIINKKGIKKNQGLDVFYHFMKKINSENGKIFFLGSSNQNLKKISKRSFFEYPKIKINTYSPPFKQELDDNDNLIILDLINEFRPDVLFVGMTCPKQEKWVYKNKSKINAKYIVCIGAVFDWYAGSEKKISPIWWKLNLGWLIRTINRPEILRRYPNIGIFFLHLFFAVIGIKKYRNGNIQN